ncbi:helicase HerA domain-containing protein [Limnoraphis robusta]|uniref:helicase HerA domain-containing protein n=1 Tax=Limnoraphis robusta TaxID=1118279 RepID=UPI003CC9836F
MGDVLYLRERGQTISQAEDSKAIENGVIVQIISKGIANYPQADSKALFRLLTSAHSTTVTYRSYNEPKEIIDEFLIGEFVVRASVQRGEWREPEGKVVTRNVDIFPISPEFLTQNIIAHQEGINILLGEYKERPVEVYAGGFEKVNLITGMKGGGKSHITKGIIHLQRKLGMPSIVFDINGEYNGLPKSHLIRPTENLRFRLDQLPIPSLFSIFDQLSLFNSQPTDNAVKAKLPELIEQRIQVGNKPDLQFLRDQAREICGNQDMMRGAYERGISNLISYNIFCTEAEAREEEKAIKEKREPRTGIVSLRTVLHRMSRSIQTLEDTESSTEKTKQVKSQTLEDLKKNIGILVFDMGGLSSIIQKVIVTLVIDQLKEICRKQYLALQKDRIEIPIYPSVFFEEAHMYMDEGYIDELIPLIRHLGMNLFFVTNTPSALPDSVFRLVDNVIMTRMVNKKDIDKVIGCGLTDKRTIEGFAKDLPRYHNLFLSANNGATKNFPLVFKVRDFTASQTEGGEDLPKSGVTRSMWEIIKEKYTE